MFEIDSLYCRVIAPEYMQAIVKVKLENTAARDDP